MCFVNTCAHMPPHQPCRAAFLFSDANFIPSQLVFSQGFSMQSQMGVLPAASLFLCVSMCLHAVGDWRGFSLLAVVASHLQVFLHVCFCVCAYIMHCIYCRVQSMQHSVWSCIHRLPVGNFSNSRFSLYRLVWPEPCGTKQQEY